MISKQCNISAFAAASVPSASPSAQGTRSVWGRSSGSETTASLGGQTALG